MLMVSMRILLTVLESRLSHQTMRNMVAPTQKAGGGRHPGR